MKKSLGIVLAILVLVLVVVVMISPWKKEPLDGQGPGARTSISVRFPIPIVESGQTTFYVAQDRGYYADENLDVTFEMGSRELNPVKMVASGQDDFAILGGPDALLVARSKGQPLKAIAIIHRNSNFPCILTLKSSGLTRLEQLQGKQIGFFYGHISTDVLRNVLRRNGIEYTEVDVGFNYAQLIAGKIDAEWAFTVTAGLELPTKGVEINIISPADYGVVTHGYTIFATEETIREEPDMVLRFLRASLKGIKYTVENPEQANESLIKKDPNLDRSLCLKRQLAYNAVTSHSDEYPPGYINKAMLQETYDRLVEEQVIETPFDVSGAYTTEFLEKIYRRPFED